MRGKVRQEKKARPSAGPAKGIVKKKPRGSRDGASVGPHPDQKKQQQKKRDLGRKRAAQELVKSLGGLGVGALLSQAAADLHDKGIALAPKRAGGRRQQQQEQCQEPQQAAAAPAPMQPPAQQPPQPPPAQQPPQPPRPDINALLGGWSLRQAEEAGGAAPPTAAASSDAAGG